MPLKGLAVFHKRRHQALEMEDLDKSWRLVCTRDSGMFFPARVSHVSLLSWNIENMPLMPLLHQQAPHFQLGSVNKSYEERVKVEYSTSGRFVCQASALPSHCVLCRKHSTPVLPPASQSYSRRGPTNSSLPTLYAWRYKCLHLAIFPS